MSKHSKQVLSNRPTCRPNAIHEEHDLDVDVHETAEKDITRNDNDESDFIISQTIAIARKDRQQIKQLVCVFWFE